MKRKPPTRVRSRVRSDDEPLVSEFATQSEWEDWLSRHHTTASGAWLRLAKKGSQLRTLTHAEALESALCFGWIDAQKKPENASTWLERFMPRGERSIWSKINRQKALDLVESGRMRPTGLAAMQSAQQDGRWERAYDSPATATVPDDFQFALEKNPKAQKFFATLDRQNRYAILFRIQTVKRAETRVRKIAEFIAMLERQEKIHTNE